MIIFSILYPLFVNFLQFNVHSFFLEVEHVELLEQSIFALIGIFSILLLLLSLSAYKKTGVKSTLYAAAAFGLFGVGLFLKVLEESYESFDSIYSDILTSAITLSILILFFLAIVKRNG
jgi:hypothetical protein